MKWGRVHNKKKVTQRYKFWQSVYKFRQDMTVAARIPENLLFETDIKSEGSGFFKKMVKMIKRDFINARNEETKNLPRKLKKKYRKKYDI